MSKEEKAKRQYEEATRRNNLRGQAQIASGDFVPQEEQERRARQHERDRIRKG